MEHAQRQRDIVRAFMIEKKSAVDDIEAICSMPGVDMVQFGPSDYAMSCGMNLKDHRSEVLEVEKKLSQWRWRMGSPYAVRSQRRRRLSPYIALGVRHFSLGDQMKYLLERWQNDGGALRSRANALDGQVKCHEVKQQRRAL